MSCELTCRGSLLMASTMLLAFSGCGRKPARIDPPVLEPAAIGGVAVMEYDANGDTVLDAEELTAVPSLVAAQERIDRDGDGFITKEEVVDRVQAWLDSKLGITTVVCQVIQSGKPVAGATVTFEPESFLGGHVKPASGVTDETGIASLSVAAEHLQDPKVTGAQVGFYRVVISKQQDGQETIAARYNAASTLGAEVALDALSDGGLYKFELTND